jgi:hypothetical protein
MREQRRFGRHQHDEHYFPFFDIGDDDRPFVGAVVHLCTKWFGRTDCAAADWQQHDQHASEQCGPVRRQ